MKKTLTAGLLCFMLFSAFPASSAFASGVSVSLFVPGLKQLQSGRTAKGFAIMAAELSLVSLAGYSYYKELANYDSYKALDYTIQGAEFDRYYGEYEKYFLNRNIFGAGAAAVYLVNIVDGLFFSGARVTGSGLSASRPLGTLFCLQVSY